MYPGFFRHWKHAHAHHHDHHPQHAGGGCGGGGCGPRGGQDFGFGAFAAPHGDDADFGGGPFGVRRPLRFLAHKLELSEKQVADLAGVLDELKTERAQAAVDHRRTTSAFADAIAGESFDKTKAEAAAAERVKSAERLRDAVAGALAKIHALLDPEQRTRLAYLLKTGALSI